MSRTAHTVLPAGPASATGPAAGRWLIDAERSTLRVTVKFGRLLTVSGTFGDVYGAVEIADAPADSTVQVSVGTASLSSGSGSMDALMHGARIVDSARNPTIDFVSSTLRAGRTADCWLVDGLLATANAVLDVTLEMAAPVVGDGWLTFRATAALPSLEAVRLLSPPGIERVLGPILRLDLTVVAVRA